MKRGVILAGSAAAILAAGYGVYAAYRAEAGIGAVPVPPTQPTVLPRQGPAQAANAPSNGAPGAPAEGHRLQRVPIPPVDTRAPAWMTLAQAREAGDARTPPIQRDEPVEAVDPAILEDHKAYAANEFAQKQRLAAAYVRAAEPELERLQSDLDRGRAAGIPQAELDKVAEKIRRIEEQKAKFGVRSDNRTN